MMSAEFAHVLVVDDDPALRDLLSEYLGGSGFSVATAGDGAAMRRALAERVADVIVLDLMLPGEDGLTLARELRGQSQVPILMLSARGEEIDRVVGLEVGADDYLAKPFSPRELLARLRALLRRSRQSPQAEPAAAVDLPALLAELAGEAPEVTVRCPPIHLEAAPVALRRALANLLDNARLHAAGRPVEVVVVRADDPVRIGVLDRGPGIPDDQLQAVFDPFHRVDRSRSRATGGAGLGLTIVRQLADANGWQVELKPRDGGGLEAWLTLPKTTCV